MKSNNEYTKNIFEKMPISKALFTMAVPTIAAQLIILIYSLADTFFIGQTDNPNMVAAVSLLLPIYNLTVPLANMTGIGGGTLMSILIAKNDNDEPKKVCCVSYYICLFVALVFALIFLLFIDEILYGLGATSETFIYAKQYALIVIICGAIPTSLSNTMSNLIRSCGFSKEAGLGITLGGVLNIILDPLFMFVIFDKGNEIQGAAVATLISNIISMIYFLIISYRIKSKSSINYNLKCGLPKTENMIKIFMIGVPASVNSFLFDVGYIILDKLMSAYGAASLAALGIVLKAERLPLNIGVGISQAMVPIVAYNRASNNYERMNKTIKLSLGSGICVAVVSFVLYQLFTPQIMGFFIDDFETIEIGTVFLRFRSMATTFMFISFYYNFLFQAFGEGRYSMWLGIIRWCAFNFVFLFVFNKFFGEIGLVLTQLASDSLTALLSIIIYMRYKKKYLKKEKI